MPNVRRSSRLNSHWLIVFDFSESATQRFQLVNGVFDTESSIQSSFPHAFVRRLPVYMFSVLAALKSNSIFCSFCADTLLTFIAKLARTFRSDLLCQRHTSEESFIDECIEIVCCGYIYQFCDHGKYRLRLRKEEYINLLKTCKMEVWIRGRKGIAMRIIWDVFLLQMSFIAHLTSLLELSLVHLDMSRWSIVRMEYDSI
jgi:hypothetical protein